MVDRDVVTGWMSVHVAIDAMDRSMGLRIDLTTVEPSSTGVSAVRGHSP